MTTTHLDQAPKTTLANIQVFKMILRKYYRCPMGIWSLFKIKVFRYSFSEAIPIFFNRFKSDFFLVWSL